MKSIKYLALALLAMVSMASCSDDDDNNGNVTPINRDFTGYIFVSSQFFQDSYYGDEATLSVKTVDDKYVVKFHDQQWGDVTFEDVKLSNADNATAATLSATSKITISGYRGQEPTEYDATLGGTMMQPTITAVFGNMGATTITFYPGEAPLACQLNGRVVTTQSVMVGDQFGPYTVTSTCNLSAKPDGTLTVSLPEYALAGTPMGNLTIGAIAISGLTYDAEQKAFVKAYAEDGLKQHFKAENGGAVTMDADYAFTEDSKIVVNTEGDVVLTNTFGLGRMPFTVTSTYSVPVEE